jgi:hypothetical protein
MQAVEKGQKKICYSHCTSLQGEALLDPCDVNVQVAHASYPKPVFELEEL